ncbi:MAG TPA: phosphoribosylanthranilate isomerase [Candidatus Eisenbacteria bacterium]|nr:phosphoribosylanthranilate isomerase [Candidatus Eisenbacteria bacterium]
MTRTRVKVCGLTRAEDAAWALACGADWLGFLVRGEGPRAIAPERAREIVAGLEGAVAVAVMVGVTPDEALALATRAGAARVQLHRVDPRGWPADFPLPCAFAVGVDGEGRLTDPEPAEPHLALLDRAHPTLAGGTGRAFPWAAARALAARRAVMLAGGLDGDNVAEAIRAARPFGVDASSRLESSPGVKDRERLRRFVAAAREADERADAAR